ncbi:MAG: FAD-dependent oxidoreductase [Candidatus Omnitrophota bacterium]|nr:FAD-dependent oxidoreductase [Candidatus Omnitrophota bacterium]
MAGEARSRGARFPQKVILPAYGSCKFHFLRHTSYGIFSIMLIKSDKDIIGNYFEDSSNLKGGYADKVVIPENTEELAYFMRETSHKKVPVTISGGGTGTVGSRIPFGGVVVSMERFNKLSEISRGRMSATLSAGVLVEELKNSAEKEGLFYASHPTERSASVGGTAATNASGSRSFRYGPTRKHVRRLKMVLPDGEILELRRGQALLDRQHPAIRLPSGRFIKIPVPGYRMPDV